MDFEQDSCRSSKENNDYFPLVILAKVEQTGFLASMALARSRALILPW